jgi:hypothetical protein
VPERPQPVPERASGREAPAERVSEQQAEPEVRRLLAGVEPLLLGVEPLLLGVEPLLLGVEPLLLGRARARVPKRARVQPAPQRPRRTR